MGLTQRLNESDERVSRVIDLLTKLQKEGPENISSRDIHEMAKKFGILMLEYGYPQFNPMRTKL